MKTYLFILICLLSLNSIGQASPKAPVTVTVLDPESVAIANDKIVFVGQKTGKTITGITDVNGKFKVEIPAGDTYDIKIVAIGDDLDYNTLEIPTLPANAEFEEMELTIMYWLGDSFTLSNLNFETGKSTIKASSYSTLDELVDYLKRKKDLVILIAGFTDNVGEEDKNLILSKNRAIAVKTYLQKKGISEDRLKTEGYGESQPIADNSTAQGRAENRRTEVHIIE